MRKLLISPKAEIDLEKIYEYTFLNWGLNQAELYNDQLFDGMNLILQHNHIGTLYLHTNIEYRIVHINKHLIFYRFENENCIVVRVLHDRMNLKNKL